MRTHYKAGDIVVAKASSAYNGAPVELQDGSGPLLRVKQVYRRSLNTIAKALHGGPIRPAGTWLEVENTNGKSYHEHAFWFRPATELEAELFSQGFKTVKQFREDEALFNIDRKSSIEKAT